MKKIVLAFLTLFILGCEKKVESEKQIYKVGTAANYPPFEYLDGSKIVGFDVDILNAIGEKIGVKFEFINMNFDGLIPAIKANKIDLVVAGMSATEDRKKSLDFSKSYYLTENLFIKHLSNSDINKKEDLENKKIGVQLGSIQELAANKIPNATIVPVEDMISAIMFLKNGKVDAVLIDLSVGYGYLKENKDLASFLVEPDGSEGFSIGFDKNKHTELLQKINQTIDEIQKNDIYDEILQKYNLK